MRRLLIFTFTGLSLAIGLTSCEKDCISNGIAGEWTWVKSVGGIGGTTITPADAGYMESLKIDDFLYQRFLNDTLDFELQYNLEIRENPPYTPEKFIVFPSGTERGIEISETELTLWDLYPDGYMRYYKRKK